MENKAGTAGLSKPKEEATVVADKIPTVKGLMRRGLRDFHPAHYLVKITSFSASGNTEAYKCGMFEAGVINVVYPKGNKAANGSGFISVYLEIAETKALPQTGEVNLMFKLFVLDQIRDKYLTVEDSDGEVKRLIYKLKPRCGFSRFLSLETFTEPNNGYLVEDCCVFGAEVHVFEHNSMKLDCFSNMELEVVSSSASATTFSWKIENFSKLNKSVYCSDSFTVADLEWKLKVFPKRINNDGKGKGLSVYLELVEANSFADDHRRYAKFTLSVRNQVDNSHLQKTTSVEFSSTKVNWGFHIPCRLKNSMMHQMAVVNDTVIIEATIINV